MMFPWFSIDVFIIFPYLSTYFLPRDRVWPPALRTADGAAGLLGGPRPGPLPTPEALGS